MPNRTLNMKTILLKNLGRVVAAVAIGSLSSLAMAASTWTMSMGTQCGASGNGTSYTSVNCSSTAVSGTSTPTANATAYTSSANSESSTFSASVLKYWGTGSGFGVQRSGDGEHSLDNQDETDFIALDFGDVRVNLSQITLGWSSGDSDITVMAYTNTGDPTLTGRIDSFRATNGWTSITNYGSSSAYYTGGSPDIVRTTTDTATYSSWWLISAFNSNYGAGSLDSHKDYVKLLSIAGSTQNPPTPPSGVSEPGSLALLGLGLVGMLASRRRSQKAASA
jgi:hypothetical protein